jgi:hypothetical protein
MGQDRHRPTQTRVPKTDPAPALLKGLLNHFALLSLFADANGRFIDAPFGVSASSYYVETFTQTISVLLRRYNWQVRVSNWSTNGTSPGHGNITNHLDVTLSR